MFDSLSRSWNLAKASLAVLRQDPELMLFPILSFIAILAAAGTFGGTGLVAGGFGGDEGFTAVGVPFLIAFYFVFYFITIYFQVALVACVKLRLAGGNPNLWYGLREANKRLWAIASWAVIAALVSLLLRALQAAAERSDNPLVKIPGQIVIWLMGAAWSVAIFFVIPVIAYEGVGGLEALKRSAGLIKRRWGEALIGRTGIGLVIFLLALVPLAIAAVGFGLMAGGATVAGIIFIVPGILGIVLLVAMGSTLQSIYSGVLYEYAMAGQVTSQFSQDDLEGAFRSA